MSASVHVIRLLGPWELSIAPPAQRTPGRRNEARDSAGEIERVRLPDDWPVVQARRARNPVWMSRRFHRPTGSADAAGVSVCFPEAWGVGAVHLNGAALETTASQDDDLDIEHLLLRPRGDRGGEGAPDAAASRSVRICRGKIGPYLRSVDALLLSLQLDPVGDAAPSQGCVWLEIFSPEKP